MTIDGASYEVTIHLATHNGAPRCVGVDLRATGLPVSTRPTDGDWAEVNTTTTKHLRLPELVARAWRIMGDVQRAAPALAATRPRPGRPPLVKGDQLLRVAEAFNSTTRGHQGAAVQQALRDLGVEGNGHDGGITPDQANRAIAAARRAKLLPPASNRGKGTK